MALSNDMALLEANVALTSSAQHAASPSSTAIHRPHALPVRVQDERVSKGMRELPPELQQHVMQQDLDAARCRNPSAVMWSRVSAAQKSLAAPGLPAPLPYKRPRESG